LVDRVFGFVSRYGIVVYSFVSGVPIGHTMVDHEKVKGNRFARFLCRGSKKHVSLEACGDGLICAFLSLVY
jgi:hypothetical protein